MTESLSVTKLLRNFAHYIGRVAYRGERFILTRGKKPVAELGPVPTGKRAGDLPFLLQDLPHLSEDEAERLSEDLEKARSELSGLPARDPWGS